MSHPNVVYLIERDRPYNPWKGPGWYFTDPRDEDGLNVSGPYKTEDLAQESYYNYCEAAYG